MYYTEDHEWIDYLGVSALVGIHRTKLSGINKIQQTTFCPVPATLSKGDVIATLYSETGKIEVYMPVDGRVVAINPKLLNNPSLILDGAQHSMWIAKISPNAPYVREGLLPEHQYELLASKPENAIYGLPVID